MIILNIVTFLPICCHFFIEITHPPRQNDITPAVVKNKTKVSGDYTNIGGNQTTIGNVHYHFPPSMANADRSLSELERLSRNFEVLGDMTWPEPQTLSKAREPTAAPNHEPGKYESCFRECIVMGIPKMGFFTLFSTFPSVSLLSSMKNKTWSFLDRLCSFSIL